MRCALLAAPLLACRLDIGNTEFPGGESKVSSTALTPNEDLKQRITDWYRQGVKQ